MIHIERCIRRLRAAHPNYACGPDTIALYVEKLAPIAPHALERAVEECIEHVPRFPAPSEILDRCRKPEYYRPFQALPAWADTQDTDRNRCGGTLRHGLLAGQPWEQREILNRQGVRGMPNSLFHRAHQAAREDMDRRLDENIERNRATREAAGETS